jgi:hypothetical protein
MKDSPRAIDKERLKKADQAARLKAKEDRDREGYLRMPQRPDEWMIWEAEVVAQWELSHDRRVSRK